MNTTHSIQTPRGVAGAIGMIRLQGDDLQEALAILEIQPVAAHGVQVRSFMGIDSGVLAWWGDDSVMLMPHGGVAVVRALCDELESRGIRHEESRATYPEAHDEHESRMLETMSRAASPLAVDLLLQQPERWRTGLEEHPDSHALNHLITPPIVAGIGRANIGKSSLLNALAGVHVALVADHAGTTRDHVGVRVDLGGLVVHWVDTPGIDETIADDGSIEIATQMIRSASLVVHCLDCGDAIGGQSGGLIGTIDPRLVCAIGDETPVVRALTRCDQIPEGVRDHDPDTIWTSAKTGSGIGDLVRRIREGLVPAHLIADPRPWRFWND